MTCRLVVHWLWFLVRYCSLLFSCCCVFFTTHSWRRSRLKHFLNLTLTCKCEASLTSLFKFFKILPRPIRITVLRCFFRLCGCRHPEAKCPRQVPGVEMTPGASVFNLRDICQPYANLSSMEFNCLCFSASPRASIRFFNYHRLIKHLIFQGSNVPPRTACSFVRY